MSQDHADIDRHVRGYLIIGGALLVLTVVTVLVSGLDVSVPVALTIGLFIACIKGGMVACFFMHLIDEKKLIYWVLSATVACFFVLLLVPLWTSMTDQVGEPVEKVEGAYSGDHGSDQGEGDHAAEEAH